MSSRKPLNTENEVDIFTHTASIDYTNTPDTLQKLTNGVQNVQKMNQVVKAAAQSVPKLSRNLPVTTNTNKKTANMPDESTNNSTKKTQQQTNAKSNRMNNNANNSFNIENSANGFSPTRSNTFGSAPRIVKRELWWKEHPTEFQIPEAKPFKPAKVTLINI